MNNRLIFIVEGDCEVSFVERKVIPYLYSKVPETKGWFMNAQKITTNRRLNKKGGNIGYEYLKNEIQRCIGRNNVWITTFLDYFRLPNDFPNYSVESQHIDLVEKGLKDDIGYDKFIPYIQKYEFETLLFASVRGFELLLDDDRQIAQVNKIIHDFPDIEDINGGCETAPSKRLATIFDYHKTTDSELILSELDMETIMEKCSRFNAWINNLLGIFSM